ncbi:MAG: carboxypeptidase regulatory-like domain-containing protein [Kofleriaceae bacterium]
MIYLVGRRHRTSSSTAETDERGSDHERSAGRGARPKGMYDQAGVAARHIAGVVLLDGKPKLGAQVSLRWTGTDSDLEKPPVVVSDKDGRFDFGPRDAERYTVSASSADAADAVVEIDLRDPLVAPESLTLRLGACTHSVVGVVSDASGTGIGGALVARVHAPGVLTHDDGKFRLCLARGSHAVRVAAQGYGAVILQVDGSGETHRDVVLVPEGTVEGVVVRKDGTPVDGALVAAWPVDEGPSRAAEAMTHSSSDGRFSLHGLSAGRFTVWGSTERLLGSATIVVVPGANAEVKVILDEFATLGGKVLAGDRPVVGASVYARATERAVGSPIGITQRDGSFQLKQVPIGPATIVVQGYQVLDPKRVTVAGPDAATVVVHVAPLGSISGKVVADGQPVPGAMITAGQRDVTTTSSGDGAFTLRGLAPGQYQLHADLDGTGSSPIQAVSVAVGEQRNGVVLDLSQRGSIEGTIVDDHGAPLEDAIVVWSRSESEETQRGTTDSHGRYSIGSLVGGGAYHPTVRRHEQETPLPIVAGQTSVTLEGPNAHASVDLTVKLARMSISGTVVDQAGAGVPDARVDVVAQPQDGAAVFYGWVRNPGTMTAESGAFTIPGLAAGTYAVRARGADNSEAIVRGVTAGTRDVRLELRAASSIEVTLVGFSETPSVDAQNVRGDFKTYYGMVNGDRATLTGLPPGRYIVTAHDPSELDAALVDVAPGARSSVQLSSHGSGHVTATVREFVTNAPVPGMACLVYPIADRFNGGVALWDMSTAPVSGPDGRFAIDPAAAGSSVVYCYTDGMSSSRAYIHLERGGTASVQLLTVHRENPGLGDMGVDFDQGFPIVVNGVRDNGAGARAGIRSGDQLVALGGHEIGELSKGGVLAWIANQPVGSKVPITVQRGEQSLTLTVVVGNSETH